MQEIRQQERRRSRIHIGQPLKVRPFDARDAHFEETSTTRNVSRDGIYFLSKNNSFHEGMRLSITLPFTLPMILPIRSTNGINQVEGRSGLFRCLRCGYAKTLVVGFAGDSACISLLTILANRGWSSLRTVSNCRPSPLPALT